MRKSLIALIILGAVLLLAGFLTEIVVSNQKVWATHSYADSRILPPLSDSLTTFNVSKRNSVLQILVSANSTLVIYVLQDEKVEWKWEDTEFKKNVLLLNADIWTVRILNNSTTSSCAHTSTIILKEPDTLPRKPYIWLRTPLLISGGLSLALTVPTYLFDRFRNRLNKKTIEIFIAVIIIFLVIFSYQIAGFFLQTSNPWVVEVGVSMEPAINLGDLVILTGTEPKDLVPDDIILFQKVAFVMNGEEPSTLSVPLLHRILYLKRVGNHTYFKTKGDNNARMDEWLVPDEGVIGKAALILSKLGYILLTLERIEVKLLIIGIILVFFFVWPEIKSKKRERPPKKEKLDCHNASNGSKGNHSVHLFFRRDTPKLHWIIPCQKYCRRYSWLFPS